MRNNAKTPATIAVLHAGELGSALGKILRRDGYRVVTTLEGRGPATRRACAEAGLEVLGTLGDVARAAELVLSVVPPTAARAVAAQFAACCQPGELPRLYVDLNSVGPATARDIAALVTDAGMDFVDGAVHGLAARLPERGTIYLSGPSAEHAAGALGKSMSVRVLNNEPGTASALKMLIAGLNKGVVALFLEMAVGARRVGLLDTLLGCCRESYPGIFEIVERTLPTYPRHATRRADELGELADMLRSLELRPGTVVGAQELLREMGKLALPQPPLGAGCVREILEASYAAGLASSRREPEARA
jgi:3-hydroxyisobutyrate dehydrogenase-like beta-hydroxyacid dehydrogenase